MARMASNEMQDAEEKVSIINIMYWKSRNNNFCFALARGFSDGVFLDISYKKRFNSVISEVQVWK